jgi:hypothetical protein
MLSPEIASRRQTIDIIQGRQFWTTHAHSWRGRHLRQQVGWRLGCYRYVFIRAIYAFLMSRCKLLYFLCGRIFFKTIILSEIHTHKQL